MHKLREQIMNFDWSLKSIVKAAIGLVVIVVALAIVVSVLKFATKGLFGYDRGYYGDSVAQNFAGEVMESIGFDGDFAMTKSMSARGGGGMMADMAMAEPMLDSLPPYPYEEGGDDAEDYERRNYNARYETKKKEEVCTAVVDLKPLDYVVFDQSDLWEDWCSYTFRAEVEHEDEVVETLKNLDPSEFSVFSNTIERSVEYTDSELAMQQRRLASTQETLKQAEDSFNSLIARATRDGDTATLSTVINNKISTIERLNQQILNTQERIDRLTRQHEGQIDQIEYAHFHVYVERVQLFDSEELGDVWKQRVQDLFYEVNETLLALTVGLISFVLAAVQFIIFAALTIVGLVLFAKILWVVTRRIWKWKKITRNNDVYEG